MEKKEKIKEKSNEKLKVAETGQPGDLKKNLAKLRRDLLELRFQKSAQQLVNFQKIKQTRREIARNLTLMNKKENK